MRLSHLSAVLGLLAVFGLGGCVSSPPTTYYQLPVEAMGSPGGAAGPALLLGPVTLADYLKRESLVQRRSDGTLLIGGELRWAGSLEDDVAQLLLRQLAVELDTGRVALYPDRVGFAPDVQVLLNIARLDSGPEQAAVLEAHWRVLDGQGTMQGGDLVRLEEPHDGTAGDQVRAQGELLRQLARQLAMAIGRGADGVALVPEMRDGDAFAEEPQTALPTVPSQRSERFTF